MMCLNILKKGFINKKEAIAYAQIALETMNRTNNTNLSLADLAMNIKSAFRLYNRDMALITANAKVYAERRLAEGKNENNLVLSSIYLTN